MKKSLAVFFFLFALFSGSAGGALAITMFSEKLAGIGNMKFTNEVEVVKIKIKSLSEVNVTLDTTLNTVADRTYIVEFYGDGVLLGTQNVSWTLAQIGQQKKVDFTGLSLELVTEFDVDVVY